MPSRLPALASLALVLLLQGGAPVPAARAQGTEVVPGPETREVLALTRALAYDRKLAPKGGSTLVLGVVFRESDPLSVACADQVGEVLAGLSGTTIRDHPVSATRIAWTGAEAFKVAAGEAGLAVAYACAGLDSELEAFTESTRDLRVVSAAFSREYVELGVSLGVVWEEGRHRILVNLPASRAEGSAFRASLLDLAEVIR